MRRGTIPTVATIHHLCTHLASFLHGMASYQADHPAA